MDEILATEQGPPESLFHQLYGGHSHMEVKVSRAFATCFHESPAFARAILQLLYKTCRVPGSPGKVLWNVKREVSGSHGRPDIEIRAPGLLFRLESKVGAPLERQQLLRYRLKGKGEYLLALTKSPPQVGKAWMTKKGVFALRWQDIHRAVAGVKAKSHEGYLRDSFCLYLEELRMAHREDVRVKDLARLHLVLDAIAASRFVRPKNAFDVAQSCLHLLREVARDAPEELPKLQNWARRGPFYFREELDGESYHVVGFTYRRPVGPKPEYVGAGIFFRSGDDYRGWEVWRSAKGQDSADFDVLPIKSICDVSGALDRGKMLQSFVTVVRKLGFKG